MIANGHKLVRFTMDNCSIKSLSRNTLLRQTFWNGNTIKDIRDLIRSEQIDLIHSHNTFPLISPSIYSAASREGIPIVQTLHNYRLICAAATLSRGGAPCKQCITSKTMAPAILHRCYHDSVASTLAVVGMLQSHRVLGTWSRKVTRYIALTEFMRQMLIEGGIPAGKISVKPNFSPIDLTPRRSLGQHALFVGMIVQGKGINTLVEAWSHLPSFPLKIAGGGPEEPMLAQNVRDKPHISVMGIQSQAQIQELMRNSCCLVVPSLWYEGFPMVIAEAFSAGIPVIVSGHGGMAEIVKDGVTGLHFKPGDAADLAAKAAWLAEHPQEALRMGSAARAEFEDKYTARANYRILLDIYQEALDTNATGKARRTQPLAPTLK
ncbi:MAG: glycosyltransferase [Acidobacteria bacterium]|nr:glycosyltransferase [Acidobacteriota bacterium]